MDLKVLKQEDFINPNYERGTLMFLAYEIQCLLLSAFNREIKHLDLVFGASYFDIDFWQTYDQKKKEIALYPQDNFNFSFIYLNEEFTQINTTKMKEIEFSVYFILGKGFVENDERMNLLEAQSFVFERMKNAYENSEIKITKKTILSDLNINTEDIKKFKNIDFIKYSSKIIF